LPGRGRWLQQCFFCFEIIGGDKLLSEILAQWVKSTNAMRKQEESNTKFIREKKNEQLTPSLSTKSISKERNKMITHLLQNTFIKSIIFRSSRLSLPQCW
jgi:hypothetical protein